MPFNKHSEKEKSKEKGEQAPDCKKGQFSSISIANQYRGTAVLYLKGAYKKDGDRLFSRACRDRTRGNGFKLKEDRFRLDIRKKFIYNEGGASLAQVAQGGGRCPIPGTIQGQAGRDSE